MRYSDKQTRKISPEIMVRRVPCLPLSYPFLLWRYHFCVVMTHINPFQLLYQYTLILTRMWKSRWSPFFSPPSYFSAVYVEHPWCSYLGLKISEQRSVRSLIFLCLIFISLNNCFELIGFHFLNTLLDVVYTYLTVSGGEGYKKTCLCSKDSRSRQKTILWIRHMWNKKQKRQNPDPVWWQKPPNSLTVKISNLMSLFRIVLNKVTIK